MKFVTAFLIGTLLSIPEVRADEPASPPEGWKEYTAKDKSFKAWLPEGQGDKKESVKTLMPQRGQMLRFASVTLETKAGGTYEASTVTISPYSGPITRIKAVDRVDIIRDLFVDSAKGKASGEKEIKQGRVPGKEFSIESGDTVSRNRVFSWANRFFVVSVSGTKAQVMSKEATMFLDSYKIPENYTGPIEKPK